LSNAQVVVVALDPAKQILVRNREYSETCSVTKKGVNVSLNWSVTIKLIKQQIYFEQIYNGSFLSLALQRMVKRKNSEIDIGTQDLLESSHG
jgi:hypothetical protein